MANDSNTSDRPTLTLSQFEDVQFDDDSIFIFTPAGEPVSFDVGDVVSVYGGPGRCVGAELTEDGRWGYEFTPARDLWIAA